MSGWLEWYEDKFTEMSGDEEPLRSMGRALFYFSFATWTFPLLAGVFALQDALDDIFFGLFGGPGAAKPSEEKQR